MQETVKLMWERFDQFEIGTDFLAWGTTIAYYRVLTFRKRKQRNELVFDDETFKALHDRSDAELRDAEDYLTYLGLCLKKLKTSDRGLIKLRYVNGLPMKQIAVRLGQNLKSIYRSFARIQSLLRHCIKQQLSSEEWK
jgi:RNA polymerase sigma-70 factor (ECF subfamily)